MSNARAPFGRLERILARLDFAWGVSGPQLDYIRGHDLWMNRFRPGGPHALWIGGHLAFYESGALRLYQGLDTHPLADWKELFGNGSPSPDEPSHYPSPQEILGQLQQGRQAIRACVARFGNEDLDRPVENERLAIRDLQSQIEFMIWHDSHHAAQLGAIINNFKQRQAA